MADWNWGGHFGADDDDENDEEGGFKPWQFATRDGLIFLIDTTKPMFEKEEDSEESPFDLCIKCAKSFIQNKIISNTKDLFAVVFFGTEKSRNSSDFKHIFVLHDLAEPGAERVLQLEALINEPDNDDFDGDYGHSDGFSLSDALWTCSSMFSNCTQKLGTKRVMLFTNNDNPHSGNAQLRRQVAAKAKDLQQNGIDMELMHMNRGGHKFDIDAFYKDILFTDEDEDTATPDPSEKFEELLTRVRAKIHKKRAQSRVKFSLGSGLDFSVGVYNLVRTCYKPPMVRLYKKTNDEIKSVTKTFLENTGEVLMPQDMKKSQVYAGRKILLENEEVTEIKKFDTPGLTLMGFKPSSRLKKYYHVRPAQFIYPDETNIEGSTTVFSALLKKCLDRDVIAVCRFIPRRNAPPKFVALVAQKEEFDEQKVQITPPGFQVIYLPFADDFRKIKPNEGVPRANEDQIEKAKALVRSLKFKFSPDSFENPALQQHYVNVEAMALDRDETEEITDHTIPNEKLMEKKGGKFIAEFKDLVFPEGYVPGQAPRKRAAGGAGGGAAKKPKVDASQLDIEKEAKEGRLGKLTVAVLKDCIKSLKIQTSGTKKADLIDAISDHFGL